MVKRNYKQELNQLIKIANNEVGRRVRFDYTSPTWRGMNPSAAKELHEKGELLERPPKDTILINKYSEHNNKLKSQTLRHEIIEDKLMQGGHMKYKTAHKHACRLQSGFKPLKEKY